MKLVVWKKYIEGEILYRSVDPAKKRRQCYTTPQSENSKKTCPIYANSACFKSKAIVGTEEQHFKGCSSFDVPNDAEDNEDTVCSQFELGEVTGLSCKSVCNGGDFCNDLSAQGNGEMCYTCEAGVKI